MAERKSVNVLGLGEVIVGSFGGVGIVALAFGGDGMVVVVARGRELFRSRGIELFGSIKRAGIGGRLVEVAGRKGRSGLIRRPGTLGSVGIHEGLRDKQSAWRLKRPGRYLIW